MNIFISTNNSRTVLIRKCLAGVENAVRIEGGFEALLDRNLGRGLSQVQVAALDVADAMFAGNRAAEGYCEAEDFVNRVG